MQQPHPTSGMAQQGIILNPEGCWCFRCSTCNEVFTSSQGLAGHQKKHKSQGTWIKGAPHEKFFCPFADLPALYRHLGNRKSTPTVSPGQGHFYRPHLRNLVVQGPRRLPGRPRSIFDIPQLKVPRVAASVAPLLVQNSNLFANHLNQVVENINIDVQEELDLELRL